MWDEIIIKYAFISMCMRMYTLIFISYPKQEFMIGKIFFFFNNLIIEPLMATIISRMLAIAWMIRWFNDCY